MIKEARQLHRNIKRCIFILLSTLIAFACTSLADMITGYGIITPMLAAVLTAAVIPLCCTGFRNVKSDIKGNMTPSGFISQGKPDKKFFIRSAVCGLICGAISALFLTLAGGVMSAQQVSSVMLTLLTVMTGAMCLVVTDRSIQKRNNTEIYDGYSSGYIGNVYTVAVYSVYKLTVWLCGAESACKHSSSACRSRSSRRASDKEIPQQIRT